MGQNGTFCPSSWAIASARAVFPVPGAPARRRARPEKRRDLISWRTRPQAWCRALKRGSACGWRQWAVSKQGLTDLASGPLTDETGAVGVRKAVVIETEALDVRMRSDAGLALALRDAGSHDGERWTTRRRKDTELEAQQMKRQLLSDRVQRRSDRVSQCLPETAAVGSELLPSSSSLRAAVKIRRRGGAARPSPASLILVCGLPGVRVGNA